MSIFNSEYDPYEHIANMDVYLEWGDPGLGNAGLYIHEQKLIILKRGMSHRQERCVLTHEIVHAQFGDSLLDSTIANTKVERRTNRLTAEKLVNKKHLLELIKTSPDPGKWCLELEITPDVLEAFFMFFKLPTTNSKSWGCFLKTFKLKLATIPMLN